MPFPENFDAWAVKLAGVAGSLTSLLFLRGSWPERAFTALAGVALSYFLSPVLASRIGLPEGLTGYLVGLFGMAVVSRAWEWVQTTPVGALWQILLDWLKRRSGK